MAGILINPSDIESLEKALETLLSDRALRLRLGTAVRTDYELHSTAGVLKQKFEQELQRIDWPELARPHDANSSTDAR